MRNRSRSPVRRRSRSRSPHRVSGMRSRREVRNQSCRVYISNLNYEVKWMKVKDVFKTIGNVEHVEIFTDNEGRSKGCAVVEFTDSKDAAQAIKELDGHDFSGRKIRVREDNKGDDIYKEQLKTQKEKLKRGSMDAQSGYPPQYGGYGSFTGGLGGAGLGGGPPSLGSGGMPPGLGGGLGAGLGAGLNSGLGGGLSSSLTSSLASSLTGSLSNNMSLASSIPGLGGLQAMLTAQANQVITLLTSLSQKNGDQINCSVFVSNLDYEVPWQRLKDTMRRAGNCIRCDLAVDDNKKSKGFGTVIFETPMEAITAVALFNGIETGVSKRQMGARLDRNASLHQVLQQLGIDSSNITQQTLLQLQQLATQAVLSANQLSNASTGLGATSSLGASSGLGAAGGLGAGGLGATGLGAAGLGVTGLGAAGLGATGLGAAGLGATGGLGASAGLGVGSSLGGLGNLGSLTSLTGGSASGAGLRGIGSMGSAYSSGYGDVPRNTSGGRSGGSGNTQAKLFVRNLPFSVRWQALKDKFREAGKVERAEIKLDSDNRSKGYGSVIFETYNDAQNAITLFNGYKWDGREIEVKFDRY